MGNPDLYSIVKLELRLAVARAKYDLLRKAAESLVDEVIGEHSNRNPEEQATRLRFILSELENYATNLHK